MEKKLKQARTRRLIAGITSLVLSMALLVTGTLAWRDYSQHKTTEAENDGQFHDSRLIEDFDEVIDWTTDSGAVKKEIRVANLGDSNKGFVSTYIRISVKEYMEIAELVYVKTDERYMLDELSGHFVIFESEQAALDIYPDHVVSYLNDYVTGESGWFIQTKEKDTNGQYGAYVTTDVISDAMSIEGENAPGRASDDAMTDVNHQIQSGGECAYTPTVWVEHLIGINENYQPFRSYISWNMSQDNFISRSEYNAQGGKAVAKWIWNDIDPLDPYIYWGKPLEPGEETFNVLESVELVNQPNGSFYYAIHADMEAVSAEELYFWIGHPF